MFSTILATLDQVGYLNFSVYFILFQHVFETYLDIRQHRRFAETKKTTELEMMGITDDEFLAAQKYGHAKSSFGFIKSTFGLLQTLAIFHYGILPLFWTESGKLLDRVYTRDESFWSEALQSVIFMQLYSLVSTVLGIPFDLYSTFVIEDAHGFKSESMTLRLFFTDLLKSTLLSAAIGSPIIMILLYTVHWGGEYFYVYCTLLILAINFLAVLIYPTFIQPCFNKVTALPEGALRTAIEELAKRQSFPLTQLYEVDGSKRSSHSNAYFYGFCNNKRIVLFDTLIKQASTEQVVALLGHELGHWALSHIYKNLVIVETYIFITFFSYGSLIKHERLFHDFGFEGPSIFIGLLLANFIMGPLDAVVKFFMNFVSRTFEFQADAYAVNLGYADLLAEGLLILQKENKGAMNPDPLYSAYHYTHPPLKERLAGLRAASKKSKN